jgi:hypothetical protein
MSNRYEKTVISLALKLPVAEGKELQGRVVEKRDVNNNLVINWNWVEQESGYFHVLGCSSGWKPPHNSNLPNDFKKYDADGKLAFYYNKEGKELESPYTWIGLTFSTYAELNNWFASPNGKRLMLIAEEAFINRLLAFSDAD